MLDWCCWASAEHLLTSTARYLIGCVTASCSQALHHCAVSPPPWTLSFCSYFHEFLPRKPVRNQVSWVHCQTAIWMQLFHVLRTPSHYASQSFIRAFELFHSRMQIHQSLWSGLLCCFSQNGLVVARLTNEPTRHHGCALFPLRRLQFTSFVLRDLHSGLFVLWFLPLIRLLLILVAWVVQKEIDWTPWLDHVLFQPCFMHQHSSERCFHDLRLTEALSRY